MKINSSGILYGLVRLCAFLPLPVLYLISDIFLYPLVYYLVRYRLNVVRMNLKNSFPDKTKTELRGIERKFYRHFCDSFQETIRILGMSEKEARKRMVFKNMELIKETSSNDQGVLLVLGHYGNWEYQPFIFIHLQELESKKAFNIYRPLKSKAFDHLYLKIRSHFGGVNITKKEMYRTLIRLRRDGVAGMFGLISDQSPSGANLHYWTKFLNQDTSILTGPERIAKQTGFAVIYADVEKVARGYYQTTFKLITDKPQETAVNEITEKYARLMEETIIRQPAYWLWTHKRWKHKRQQDLQKSGEVVE